MAVRKNRAVTVVCCLFLFAASILPTSFTDTVWAEEAASDSTPDKLELMKQGVSFDEFDSRESGVHADPTTFEKNFDLTVSQKESVITDIEKTVSGVIKPGTSDLQKYYDLAIEANKIAEYDWDLWYGGYDLDYYSHQWDSYGVLYEKSVCAGIGIFYSHLCHAADLPCWFARTDPKQLDHTISYIPDINGKAYYVDVTEDIFLMSDKSSPYPPVDKAFSHITRECTDYTFDYAKDNGEVDCSPIKKYYEVPFMEWFKDFGLHKNKNRKYISSPYPNADGSSEHVSYHDYRSNFVDTTDIWFLDDFYRDPADIKSKILKKQFDEQLLNPSGVKKNYDCDSPSDLENAVKEDISLKYFPSNRDGKVVAEAAVLTLGEDYEIKCTDFDKSAKTAVLTVTGKGNYAGSYQIKVKLYSAAVAEPPVPIRDLAYNKNPQELIKPGVAEGGEMQYALGDKNGPTGEFTTSIPTGTDVRKYFVWYKVVGDDIHGVTEPVRMAVKINTFKVSLILDNDNIRIKEGEKATINPKLDVDIPIKLRFESDNEDIATVDENGTVTGIKEGSAFIFVKADMTNLSSNYELVGDNTVTVEVISEAGEPSTTPSQTKMCAITYKLNGGSYNGSTDDIVEKYPVGTIISIHEAPVREGYHLDYWKGSEYRPGDSFTVTGDHTFTAQWAENKNGNDPKTGDERNILLYITLMMLSLPVIISVTVFSRKSNGSHD